MGGHAYPNLLPFPTTGPCTGGIATGTVSSSSCRYSVHCRRTSKVVVGRRSAAASVSCSAASAQAPPSQSTIKVVIVGATKKMGRAAVTAVSRARGMVLAGATDTQCIGMDAGQISGMEEALEIPVLNDLTMHGPGLHSTGINLSLHSWNVDSSRASFSGERFAGVVVDFSEPSSVYDNEAGNVL
ncbi:dihydrodipicolinate reductase-like protein CRR1, chloroplastic isoform X1 [Triticum aestivum]|uniref:dihydrodipicolinate reductase-like protein CRR1, chloroplastic isoform X1 n=1 Tax=Triticum aestivum TaxID=4565 RepID=UPI001D009BE2|nr:dihydrodipicolinate reductase-like protein CRR1, chloroplastic isoform X1 [Triticum aestivum]